MNDAPVDSLLEKLCQGDDQAAEQMFVAYEPYLRKVVRRQLSGRLRTKFDSADVVQSVWADVLHGLRAAGWRFPDRDHLRAFLVKAARNRFIDRFRKHRRALEHEQALCPEGATEPLATADPRPSQIAQADELWQRMLAVCPPAHRDILELRRQGLTLGEIGTRTGLHEDSVRRIVRQIARQLSFA